MSNTSWVAHGPRTALASVPRRVSGGILTVALASFAAASPGAGEEAVTGETVDAAVAADADRLVEMFPDIHQDPEDPVVVVAYAVTKYG